MNLLIKLKSYIVIKSLIYLYSNILSITCIRLNKNIEKCGVVEMMLMQHKG